MQTVDQNIFAYWQSRLLIYATLSCILFLLYLFFHNLSLQQRMR